MIVYKANDGEKIYRCSDTRGVEMLILERPNQAQKYYYLDNNNKQTATATAPASTIVSGKVNNRIQTRSATQKLQKAEGLVYALVQTGSSPATYAIVDKKSVKVNNQAPKNVLVALPTSSATSTVVSSKAGPVVACTNTALPTYHLVSNLVPQVADNATNVPVLPSNVVYSNDGRYLAANGASQQILAVSTNNTSASASSTSTTASNVNQSVSPSKPLIRPVPMSMLLANPPNAPLTATQPSVSPQKSILQPSKMSVTQVVSTPSRQRYEQYELQMSFMAAQMANKRKNEKRHSGPNGSLTAQTREPPPSNSSSSGASSANSSPATSWMDYDEPRQKIQMNIAMKSMKRSSTTKSTTANPKRGKLDNSKQVTTATARSNLPAPTSNPGASNSDDLDDKLCMICLENMRNALVLHADKRSCYFFCLDCIVEVKSRDRECPICRLKIDEILADDATER